MKKGKISLSLIIGLFILSSIITAQPAFAADSSTAPLLSISTRLAGYDRIDTSIAISQAMFPADSSAGAVLLATGFNYPDALAGASLGVSEKAPLLLVDTYGDNQKTLAEIKRVLKPEGKIYILGGTAVVPAALEAELNAQPAYHYAVRRLSGVTCYGTAAEIAKITKPTGGGEVIIATGDNFPDSLSISPYASAHGIPMVLVQKSKIPAESLACLQDLNPTEITLIGGVGAVGSEVEEQLHSLFPAAGFRRFGGYDQYDTSAMIADALFGDQSPNLFVATGTNFPDALAGSVFAGSTQSPIVLVKPNEIPENLSSVYLSFLSPKTIVALGGTSVVSDNVFNSLKSLHNIDPGNIQSNLRNLGLAAANDGWIYYTSGLDNRQLYKMKPDGSQATKVLNYSAGYLSAVGNSIYFVNAQALYKKVLSDHQPDPSLIATTGIRYVYGVYKQVYYANDGGLFTDGNGFYASQRILSNPRNVVMDSGYIYYQPASVMGPFSINRVNPDGSGDTVLVKDDVNSFCISDQKIFYISNNDGKIYSANLDGSGIKAVTNDAAGTLNVHNGWIYYSNQADGSRLYKIQIDGSGQTKLADQNEINAINIVGDWVFCTRGLSVTTGDSSVYMMKLDGSGQRKI
ncbi:cell wall-binding repeat-containing protein [Desulfosporosinus sp. PR]|uniref:cell wall-binding repeat-containing protein n=1 Tax=Candidatus Desulfosporosinus nitrosoreducens TaxID=3401928 RepID=UPI0027F473DB|nr:cell wall-binding repeat-containing protein [Desulfosporosinus sp. PR]MDQ7095459.1 cell wall-binding repeat-containing protein [Desulfosporosinus sp. PR]